MDKALLFNNGFQILVSAEEVKAGKYSRYNEFVDPEYEFKVKFVKGSKNNGKPYFRLYYSYEDYKKLFPDRADRYQIVCNMRRFQESQWHKQWKAELASFCEIEKYIKCPETQKWKYADAYYRDTNTVIEIQHSYIALDYEERCDFYSRMGINCIWIYDLSRGSVKEHSDGLVEILEDNARGFFRISENPENIKRCPVFIHTKSGAIYRVRELGRLSISSELKSTIRLFRKCEVYSKNEFLDAVKNNTISNQLKEPAPCSLNELWRPEYRWMIVENTSTHKTIMINRDDKGNMLRSFRNHCIQYKYVTCTKTSFYMNSQKDYSMNDKLAEQKCWRVIRTELKTKG